MSASPGPSGRYVLLVLRQGTFSTHPLPAEGTVTVGRSGDSDVVVDDAALSRRHAALHLGATLAIEDLGSANGTRLRAAAPVESATGDPEGTGQTVELDQALPPHERVAIAPGNLVQIGSTTLVVQRATSGERPRRIWPHAHFEACLEDQCLQWRKSRVPTSVVRVRVTPDLAVSAERALLSATDPSDVVSAYAPAEWAVLIAGDEARATATAQRIVDVLGAGGARPDVGIACAPVDGQSPERLVELASTRMHGGQDVSPTHIVRDPAMVRLYEIVDRVADSPVTVLLLGETGVGKEIVAEAIWRRSGRASRPFVRINCASLSEALLESELFGHEKGAFTGAGQAKRGLLETADGGTVFLDEVGELPMPVQTKLLRVLEDRQLLRVGATRAVRVDVRFVAATNRELEAEVARGAFREDLLYRINAVSLVVPPLRERTSEVEPLAEAFVARFCRETGRAVVPPIGSAARDVLRAYAWPGNLRELRNTMERAVLLCDAGPIVPEHLPLEKMGAPVVADGDALAPDERDERDRILAALTRHAGNQTQAAKALGISRGTLVARLDRYRLPRPRK